VWSLVRIEDEHISRHDMEYDSLLNGPRTNRTAGNTDEAGESDEDGQSGRSRGHDDQEADGSEEDDEDGESGGRWKRLRACSPIRASGRGSGLLRNRKRQRQFVMRWKKSLS